MRTKIRINSNKTTKKQTGTALLVTVLLIGAISLIAFGMTKITLSEMFAGTKSQEGLEANYAAQAGVEDALMRFKFHDKASLEMPAGASKGSSDVVRIYLNNDKNDPTKPAREPQEINYNTKPDDLSVDDYVYDLKVWYKEDCSASPCEYKIKKDESVLLDTSSVSNNILVNWDLYHADGTKEIINLTETEASQTALWYRLSDPAQPGQLDPTGKQDFLTVLSYYRNPADYTPPKTPINPGQQSNSLSVRTAKSLKFKAFLADTLSNGYIKITISSGIVGGPKTHIESTGYYGNTAKKIEVTVDRESKSIIDVFDYVIYSGQGALPGSR